MTSTETTTRRGGFVSLLVAVVTFVIYYVSARTTGHRSSPPVAYFDQLADSFLHGRIHLPDPNATHDLTNYNDRWYVPFPPLPAILLMPYVLIVGVRGVSTVLFASVIGAINTGLAHHLLRRLQQRGLALLSPSAIVWLTVMWGLGTIHWYTATQGSVWFLAHVCAAMFVLLSVTAALRQRAVLAGVLLGIAGLSRPSTQFLAPAIVGLVLMSIVTTSVGSTAAGRFFTRFMAVAAKVVIPAAVVTGLLFVYNKARFDSFGDFGYNNENVDASLVDALTTYGQFNVHFVPHNIWAMLLAGPRWVEEKNAWEPDPFGMSIFLTTPALLYALRARIRPLQSSPALWCWAGIVGVLIPLLTYYNTGWYQFGFRFSLDFLPVMFVLVAIGITRPAADGAAAPGISWRGKTAIVVGCLMNLGGLLWFNGG
jgi:hypothetical protein